MKLKAIYELFKNAGIGWYEDKAPKLGAALAYYSVFSLAPLLVLVISIATLVFGQEAAQNELVGQIKGTVGEQSANAIQDMLKNAGTRGTGIVATVIAAVILLFGASGVFAELQEDLNTIWKVAPKPGSTWLAYLRDRFLSFTMVLGAGFLLLLSLIFTTAIEALSTHISPELLPGGLWLWQGVNALASFLIVTLLFALIYKVLPDVALAWRDVLTGAVVTAVLFTLGKYLIGLYLGRASVASAYGAAGSLVVILVWVYYSAQILLFGAEFTRAYAVTLRGGDAPRSTVGARSPDRAPTPEAQLN
jgi:membrane protein